jgi:ATP-dependent Clp protease ATP-binding subunit ClpC
MKTYTVPDKIKDIENQVEELGKEKEEAIRVQDFEKAASLRDKEHELKDKLEKDKKKWENKNSKAVTTLKEDDIAEVISSWTNIPVKRLTQDENEKLKNLEHTLHERVIGQDEAVSAVAKAIRRGRLGLKDPNRPIGSFLFLGQTGVGKTELSKALAETLFGNEDSMIRIDMSEYMESHTVSKLIGAPPGYVGFDEAGQLTEKVRRKPYSVILFDEIEKAHPDVMNMLLQILDDGRLTDGQGRTVNFKNTVIIMTSNVGARLLADKKALGFSVDDKDKSRGEQKDYEDTKKEVIAELKKQFKPEFLNRIDETIVFHKLNNDDISKIIDIMLKKVEKRLTEQNIIVEIDKKAKELVAKSGVDDNYGARPLRRAIQNMIEDRIAEEILDGNIVPGKKAVISSKDDKIIVKQEK